MAVEHGSGKLALVAICCPKSLSAQTIFKHIALSNLGVALPAQRAYRDSDDAFPLVVFLYLKAIPMPDTIPQSDPHPAPPVDAFFARVKQEVREHLARKQRDKIPPQPMFTIPQAAALTGNDVYAIRDMIVDQEIRAVNRVSALRGYSSKRMSVLQQTTCRSLAFALRSSGRFPCVIPWRAARTMPLAVYW